mmetsp:Transcript_35012/g.87317  ORF Transcript_35012/g.87317 Transcript_35012/m.87317 type:complete len:338 (-) Transcript_35012:240-1253(-)
MAAMMLLFTSVAISGARRTASSLAGAAGPAVWRSSTAMVALPSEPASVEDEMMHLQRLSDGGSEIATRMLEARITWMEGERARKTGDCRQGTRLFAHALCLALRDGDPFSGYWQTSSSRVHPLADYHACAEAAIASDGSSEVLSDARVLQALAYLTQRQFSEAFDAVSDAIHAEPDNPYSYLLRTLIEGNLNMWLQAEADCTLAISLLASEPIFTYWRAIARRNMLQAWPRLEPHRSPAFMVASAAVIQDLESFVARTPLGSRRCSEALYEIAIIAFTILLSSEQTGAAKKRIVSIVVAACERARAADARRPEVFAGVRDSDAKRMVEMLYNATILA